MSANQEMLNRLVALRAEVRAKREAILDRAEREGRKDLTESETTAFRALTSRIEDEGGLSERIGEVAAELKRSGHGDPDVERIMAGQPEGRTGNAIAPLGFDESELRAAHAAVLNQTGYRLQSQRAFNSPDSLLPPQLWQAVVGPQHEGRILDRLISVPLEAPSVEWIQHVSTTGTAAVTAEGAAKPEAVFTLNRVIEAAVKIAVHAGVSWEIMSDWESFVTYTQSELMNLVIDAENLEFLSGAGTSGHMTGWLNTSGILTHAVSTETPLDTLEQSITALRVGSSLAVADLMILHPSTWSAVRRTKTSQGEYLTQADPTVGEASSAWGVPVLTTTQIAAGAGLVMDTRKQGRCHVREPLSLRLGYSGSDFTNNIVRSVCEERLVLAVERPSAVLAISGLPTS